MAISYVGMGYDTSPDYLAHVQGKDEECFRAGVRSYSGSTLPHAYLQIHTDETASVISQIRVSVSWRGVKKNVAGTYGSYSDTIWSEFNSPSSDCNPHTSSKYSGTDWSIELRDIGTYAAGGVPSTTLGDTIAPGSNYNFSNRIYDSVGMLFTVVATYNNGQSESRVNCNEFYLTYFPRYTLTGLTIADSSLIVSYTYGDWNRTDDRWALESLKQGGTELSNGGSVGWVNFGNIAAPGRIAIPLEAFTRIPASTSTTIDVRLNASFRAEGEEWEHVQGTVTLVNEGDCNTPTLTLVSVSEDALVVHVADANDKSNPLVSIYVTLQDYSGSDVTITATPGSDVTFPYPPLNQRITVEAIGEDADGDSSDVVTLIVGAIRSDGDTIPTIAAEDGSASVKLRFNVSMDWTYEPAYETVKFAGRSRETVGYGVGGSVIGDLQCDILDDESYGDHYQSRSDFEALAFAGICVYRDESGSRKRVSVDSVGESWDTVRRVKTMKLQVREVS